jgi:hypothetical protein
VVALQPLRSVEKGTAVPNQDETAASGAAIAKTPSGRPLLRYVCHGLAGVDESDTTDCEFNNPVVLNDFGLASYLK